MSARGPFVVDVAVPASNARSEPATRHDVAISTHSFGASRRCGFDGPRRAARGAQHGAPRTRFFRCAAVECGPRCAAVQTAGSSSFQDDFARADDTRRRQRYVLWRTAALFAAQLVCALVYFGFLCWLANIDPVRVSANTSAIAYAISILSYACASIAAVCTIAVRAAMSF